MVIAGTRFERYIAMVRFFAYANLGIWRICVLELWNWLLDMLEGSRVCVVEVVQQEKLLLDCI